MSSVSPSSERVAEGIRVRVLEHVLANNGGYMSQACSSAELLAALLGDVARLGPVDKPIVPPPFSGVPGSPVPAVSGTAVFGDPAPDRDRIIISPAHYALVVYAALIELGRLAPDALNQFNKDGSTVEMIGAEHSPGFETTTGSLSQALSTAGGIALGRRNKGESGRVFVFMSDGEFQEGQTWEALQALAHYRLDNVRVIVDVNRAQCDGPMDDVMSIEPLAQKIRAFGCSVDDINGHDIAALTNSLERPTGKPHVVLAYTDPTRGLPLLNERRPALHYLRFTSSDEKSKYAQAYAAMVGGEEATSAATGPEIVVRPHVRNFIDWSRNKPKVVVLTADLTNSCEVGQWRDTYPDRCFSMGMAEQNMLGFAAGLAREGFEPWLHTFAVFLYRRPLDQLQMSIAYPNLPVRLVGFLPGVTTPGGVTHQAIDDVAVMRAIPNMTVLETGDATEVESVLDVAHAIDGPVYIRMLRGEVIRLFPQDEPMVFNSARVLHASNDDVRSGSDVVVLTSGIMTEEALRVTNALAEQGVSLTHLHISTLKPFTDPTVEMALRGARLGVITMENHLVTGGLGSAVAELMAEGGLAVPLHRLGLPDTYAHGASQKHLLAEYDMDAAALATTIGKVLGRDLGDIGDGGPRVTDVHSSAKAEAL